MNEEMSVFELRMLLERAQQEILELKAKLQVDLWLGLGSGQAVRVEG